MSAALLTNLSEKTGNVNQYHAKKDKISSQVQVQVYLELTTSVYSLKGLHMFTTDWTTPPNLILITSKKKLPKKPKAKYNFILRLWTVSALCVRKHRCACVHTLVSYEAEFTKQSSQELHVSITLYPLTYIKLALAVSACYMHKATWELGPH